MLDIHLNYIFAYYKKDQWGTATSKPTKTKIASQVS